MISSLSNQYTLLFQQYGVTKNSRATTSYAAEAKAVAQTRASTPAEEMAAFKKDFYEELSKIQNHSSVSNVAINISEAAFQAMKDDPEYKEKILSLIKRDIGDSCAPRHCSVMLTVGSSLKDYRGDSWPVIADSEFWARSQGSFYKRKNGKSEPNNGHVNPSTNLAVQKRMLEYRRQTEQLEKDILDKKVQMALQEQSAGRQRALEQYEKNNT